MKLETAKYILDDYPKNWPPKQYFVDRHKVTLEQLEQFKKLIDKNAGETEIDGFLKTNREILAVSLSFFSTGHHGAWIIPQQEIKPPTSEPGLKPDYVVGGQSSDGFSYWIIDLKGANATIFSEQNKRLFFSNTANSGVFQVLEYMNYCSKMQSYMREGLLLNDFREPRGLLIIGREKELEENNRKKDLRAAWNRMTQGKIEIRTFDALTRAIEDTLHRFTK